MQAEEPPVVEEKAHEDLAEAEPNTAKESSADADVKPPPQIDLSTAVAVTVALAHTTIPIR